MSDPREFPANGRVAHEALIGRIDHPNFVPATDMQVTAARTPLAQAPGGARHRELIFGQTFKVLEIHRGHAFGFVGNGGYCGYVDADDLTAPSPASHRVSAVRTFAMPAPDLKAGAPVLNLSFGSVVTVGAVADDWSRIGPDQWVPSVHLTPADRLASDPVAVVRLFLGTPYRWGGNSAFGIDCSGLVQIVAHAIGVACPGDSDQQARAFGVDRSQEAPAAPGDLIFWKGHLAIALDDQRLIHANAHHMAVAEEGIAAAIARISAQGGGPVTGRGAL